MPKAKTLMDKKIFIERAIKKGRKEGYKGLHATYSGFNVAYKEYYGVDSIEDTKAFQKEGFLSIRPVKGGVLLYLASEVKGNGNSNKLLTDILEDN